MDEKDKNKRIKHKEKRRGFIAVTSVAALVSVLLSACSSMSAGNLFSHYSAQNHSMYMALKAGDYYQAADLVTSEHAGEILDNMEMGRVSFLNQDYQQSKSALEQSEQALREQQDQAVISISETASDIGALAINDNLKTYIPADYEVGFLHLYLALNYLKLNDLEGALVEVRKANQVQERAKQTRESDLQSAESEMEQSGYSPNIGAVLSRYPDAGKDLQAVQNGYLLYLSALLYETDKDLNSANIDYKRALAVMPNNIEVIDGAIRISRKLGLTQEYKKLVEQYGNRPSIPDGMGQVIVIDEQNVVAARQGWKVSLPISAGRGWSYYSLSLPYYPPNQIDGRAQRLGSIKVGKHIVHQSQLVDVNLMASQDLVERMPTILIRQALRLIAKEQIKQGVTNNHKDEIGSILMDVWNVFTEQPDTRSWQTLPAAVYSGKVFVKAGEQVLSIKGSDYRFNIAEGETTLVWLSRQGNGSTVWHKQLGRL